MLLNALSLSGFTLSSLDGDFGKSKEFYFDDRHWTIRYLIADTGHWLPGRRVLLSPYALLSVDMEGHRITVDLTKKQIEGSPDLLTDKPVTRQFEEDYYKYYGWPNYWNGPFLWGDYPIIDRNRDRSGNLADAPKRTWDPHLCSSRDFNGIHIHSSDGNVGHVIDIIIDEDDWAIRYLIIDTGSWWPGRKVLIAPAWIKRIDWDASTVFIAMTRDAIKRSPEYCDDVRLTRDYEATLHSHYDQNGYWAESHEAQSKTN